MKLGITFAVMLACAHPAVAQGALRLAYDASPREWRQATAEQRAATAALWVEKLRWKSDEPLSASAMAAYAREVEACVDDAVAPSSLGRLDSDKIGDIGTACILEIVG